MYLFYGTVFERQIVLIVMQDKIRNRDEKR